MNRLLPLCLCLVAPVAFAAGVDDALTQVQEAQHAIEGDGACKSLSTKLKLSVEALEKARKAPVKANLQQATGRLQTAKDFVAGACSEAVRATVTEKLSAALAEVEKAGQPEKKEKQGAAFEATCTASDECASEHCYVGANPKGYCTRTCTGPQDCPAKWDCRRVGSVAYLLCVKP